MLVRSVAGLAITDTGFIFEYKRVITWHLLIFFSLAKWKITSINSFISITLCLVKLIYVTMVTFVLSLCAEDCRGADRLKVRPACGLILYHFRAGPSRAAPTSNEQEEGYTYTPVTPYLKMQGNCYHRCCSSSHLETDRDRREQQWHWWYQSCLVDTGPHGAGL